MINPNLTAIFPFYSVELVLMFSEKTQLPFFHRACLSAFFRHLLGKNHTINYHGKLAIETCEDGQIYYQTGDYYRCGLIVYEAGMPLLTQLLTELKQLPDSLPINIPKSAPFAHQMKFIGFQDRLHNGVISDVLTPYNEQSLIYELDLWREAAQNQGLNIRTLSPLAITYKRDSGQLQLCRNPKDLSASMFLKTCGDSLQNLARAQGKNCTINLKNKELKFQRSSIFTVKDGYRKNNQPKKNAKGYWKALDGVVGLMQLSADKRLNDDDLTALILGAYCGVGNNTTFGLGRYQLETLDAKYPNIQKPLQPDESLLQQATQNTHIRSCYQYQAELAKHSKKKPTAKQIKTINDILKQESTSPLELTSIPKKDGTMRLLSIPSFLDRVAQNCISSLMKESLHQYLQYSSHNYRVGRSRFTAVEQINQYYQQGYCYLFESDIEDLFPSLNWQDIEVHLRALFRQEALIQRLMTWVKAPIYTSAGSVERKQGLPQSSPISPMLANLLLDIFIEYIESKGLKVVIYSDNFVILSRQPQQLDEAEREAVRSLAKINLQLEQKKTASHQIDESYVFLGFYFQKGHLHDLSDNNTLTAPSLITTQTIVPWLLLSRQQKVLDKQKIIHRLTDRTSPTSKPLLADDSMRVGIASQGTVLTVSGDMKKVSSLNGHIQIYSQDRMLHHQPWTTIHSISLVGTHHITTPALKHAMREEVAVHFIGTSGDYLGSTVSERWQKNRLSLIKAQLALTKTQSLAIAKTIVIARTRHIKEVLRQKSAEETKKCRQTLTRLQKQAEYAKDNNQLLGIEGYVTRSYYRQMRVFIDTRWQFEGRNRRPPRDPINAMLSLGYSSLYAHVQSMLLADGLHPYIGFYHQMRPGHAALASDLMEPFRHMIEQSCWKLVNTGILTPDDFEDRNGACYFHSDALKRYFQEINSRFQKPLQSVADDSDSIVSNIYGQIHRQNISLINALTQDAIFKAYKYR